MSTATTPSRTTETEAATGLVELINPADAVVGINVRAEARLTPEFVSSIRERGVLEPVVGYRDADGRFVVLYGQRRTLAAVEANRDTIPAVVIDAPDDVDRIINQMAENDHRAAIITADRVASVKQLAAFGLTAAQIKKRTARPRPEVDSALRVAESDLAEKASQRWDFLTLDQAATLAEFETDPQAVKALTVAARDGSGFDHTAQRLRDERDDAAAMASASETLVATGVRVVEQPGYDDKTMGRLDRLAAKSQGRPFNEATHANCPGHAAYLIATSHWNTDDKGKQVRVRGAEPRYVCTDWRLHGHVDLWSFAPQKTKAADMTPAERAAAAAERRDIIESNKSWDTAESVRRDWLGTFATRRTAPKGAGTLLAHVLSEHPDVVTNVAADQLAAAWFGVTVSGHRHSQGWAAVIEKATEQRAQVIAVSRVLACLETNTSRTSWRTVQPATALYLRTISHWGYHLSAVEKRAAQPDKPTPQQRSTTKIAKADTTSTLDPTEPTPPEPGDLTSGEADGPTGPETSPPDVV